MGEEIDECAGGRFYGIAVGIDSVRLDGSQVQAGRTGTSEVNFFTFVTLFYFICYLDRVNIGFVGPPMNKDLGLSSYNFGLGAGAFFWGYRHWHRLGQLGRHPGRQRLPADRRLAQRLHRELYRRALCAGRLWGTRRDRRGALKGLAFHSVINPTFATRP